MRTWQPIRFVVLSLSLTIGWGSTTLAQTLEGTKPWADRGDPATAMVEGLHRFADRETSAIAARRQTRWTLDTQSAEALEKSVEPHRKRLELLVGLKEPRVAPVELAYVASPDSPARVAESDGVSIFAVRWSVYPGVEAEGLYLVPAGEPRADVVAIPDTTSSPETLAGLAQGVGSGQALALARLGCRVLVPTLVDRTDEFSGNPAIRITNLPHREWIQRMAYEAGRHLVGYEVDTVRAAVDWFRQTGKPGRPTGVMGQGDGGLVALYSAAIDPRINSAWVSGYFGPRESLWREPIDRNIWSLLTEFGDAEVAALVLPRTLIVEASQSPEINATPQPRQGRNDAAPGFINTPSLDQVKLEAARVFKLIPEAQLKSLQSTRPGATFAVVAPSDPPQRAFSAFGTSLRLNPSSSTTPAQARDLRPSFDPRRRMKRVVDQWVAHTQAVIRTTEIKRDALWAGLNRTSLTAWNQAIEPLRQEFHQEVIGKLAEPFDALDVRTVKLYDEPKWVGYAVELPVLPDVVASGILLLPRDLKPGEKRPVVVCQHGLEGRPEDVCDPRKSTVYRAFGATLADRGYIVYAPQNPYIGVGRFRTLQRKLNPIKLSLFAVIVAQHQQTLRWLGSRPEVDPARIAFYGLSYGGKTAMRVPAILPEYCLSICSGDFNEWVVKNTSVDRRESYMYTFEYDMYEFALAEKFNYAEMAALIAPRPFMVERGHKDGVGTDELIGYEFAKVKRTYDQLGLASRVGIAYFNDGHRIDGAESYPFLDRHLNWTPR